MAAAVGLLDKIIAGSLPADVVVPALDGLGVGAYVGWFIGIAMVGLGIGGQALIARAMGAGNPAEAECALGQAISLCIVWGILVGIFMWFMAPGLAAMFVDSGGFSNAYQSGIRHGGAFELKQATWAYNQALTSPSVMADPKRRAALEAVDLPAWFADMPWQPGRSPVTAAPEYEAYLFEQWTHGAFDDYWAQPGIYAAGTYEQCADVPQVHMSSWYDPYARTATENYTGLVTRKQGPVRLILGPWTHGDRSHSHAGEVDFGPEATLDHNLAADFFTLRLRWFDRWLRQVENGVESEPTVRVFVMGGGSGQRNAAGRLEHGGHWRHATTWPLPETQFTPYYCHADGVLAPELPALEAAPLTYHYDPTHPVPTIGGRLCCGNAVIAPGPFDQRPNEGREDVLVYSTPPLAKDVEVTGFITLVLYASTTAADTDFTAMLVDVEPTGYARFLTDGIVRARYRESTKKAVPIVPGEIVRYEIDLWATSNVFKAGHRIRVYVSSSNFPRFNRNPNTGARNMDAEGMVKATQTIYHDAAHPSALVLPVVPR